MRYSLWDDNCREKSNNDSIVLFFVSVIGFIIDLSFVDSDNKICKFHEIHMKFARNPRNSMKSKFVSQISRGKHKKSKDHFSPRVNPLYLNMFSEFEFYCLGSWTDKDGNIWMGVRDRGEDVLRYKYRCLVSILSKLSIFEDCTATWSISSRKQWEFCYSFLDTIRVIIRLNNCNCCPYC